MRDKSSRKTQKVEEKALLLLARRDHSREELRRKLQARAFTPEEIEKALEWLEERKILDDLRYAQNLAIFLSKEKLLGPQRVNQKLFQKGIPAELAKEAMEKADELLAARERLRIAMRKKLKDRTLEQIFPEEKTKLARYLRQRGFSWEDIWEVFQETGGLTEE
jgi:regulatory protein